MCEREREYVCELKYSDMGCWEGVNDPWTDGYVIKAN